ncbi:MAG: tetratricopeptide repeat protein [Planctomycetota bacterium]
MVRAHRILWVGAALALLGLAGCQTLERWFEPKPESLRELDNANELLEDERYEQAGAAYRCWLANYGHREDPATSLALFRLGRCYWLMRDYPRAARVFRKIKTWYGDSPDPAVQEAVRAAEVGLADIESHKSVSTLEESGERGR